MSWLTDSAQGILVGALDGLSRREAAIGANLANIDTPGYRPQSVDFESALREQFAATPLAGLIASGGGSGTGAASPAGGSAGSLASPSGSTGSAGSAGAMLGPSVGPSASIALRTTDPRHLQGSPLGMPAGTDITQFDASLRNDANTVDVDSEVTALATTQLKYSAVARLLSGKLGMLRDVAGDRG